MAHLVLLLAASSNLPQNKLPALLHPLRWSRAWPAPPPEAYKGHGDSQWCAPYAYKERRDLGCGGADQASAAGWLLREAAIMPAEADARRGS